jgi:hypothetical protein
MKSRYLGQGLYNMVSNKRSFWVSHVVEESAWVVTEILGRDRSTWVVTVPTKREAIEAIERETFIPTCDTFTPGVDPLEYWDVCTACYHHVTEHEEVNA